MALGAAGTKVTSAVAVANDTKPFTITAELTPADETILEAGVAPVTFNTYFTLANIQGGPFLLTLSEVDVQNPPA